MAKPKPEKRREPQDSGTVEILPMQLRVGDQLTDETGTYQVVGPPFMTAGGKTANVRVKRVESDAQMVRVYGAHERVTVKRGGA